MLELSNTAGDLKRGGTWFVPPKIGPSAERGMPHVVVRGGSWMGNVRVR